MSPKGIVRRCVVSDTLYPKFCGYFKKRGFCFVSLIGVYNFAAQKAKRKKYGNERFILVVAELRIHKIVR